MQHWIWIDPLLLSDRRLANTVDYQETPRVFAHHPVFAMLEPFVFANSLNGGDHTFRLLERVLFSQPGSLKAVGDMNVLQHRDRQSTFREPRHR